MLTRLVLLAAVCAALTGCGGGGGVAPPPKPIAKFDNKDMPTGEFTPGPGGK
jgi:predicted small lipoprotein YifL